MFRKNSMQQLNLDDKIVNMPKYLRRNLEKSWATPFHKYVFLKSMKIVLKFFIVTLFLDLMYRLMF